MICPWFIVHSPKMPSPFVVGYAMAWAVSGMLWPLCASVVCIVVGRAPRTRTVIVLGLLGGVLCGVITAGYTGDGDVASFNMEVAQYVPGLVGALVSLAMYCARSLFLVRKASRGA